MDFLEFSARFSDEAACEHYLIAKRWPQGYVCPGCQSQKAYYIKARRTFECSICHQQHSITAGTVFHKTQTPLKEWFLAIFLLSQSKKGISGLALQRFLGADYTDRIYRMKSKIQAAMLHRDAKYNLAGLNELDVAFFSESGRKTPVLLSVELDEEGFPRFLKAKTIENQSAEQIQAALVACFGSNNARFVSDGHKSFEKLADSFKITPIPMREKRDNQVVLPWVHICISNLKRFLLGTHHSVRYLARYLAEFCWRFNRRHLNLFERLIHTAVLFKPDNIPALIS
ncbi:MAG: IS1595 family transposase [Vampirovibrionales bacterium]|nr:IS1595 family transposase [Vampirovibrionales bacterium]